MSKSGVISLVFIVAAFLSVLIPFWNSHVKTDSDLKPSAESINVANKYKFAVLSSVSHLESSYKALCFAARKLASTEDEKEKNGLIGMINLEWNKDRECISFIHMSLQMNSSKEEEKFINENMELKNDPRNAPEKLPESINELREKIDFIRKILKVNSATAIFEG